jgi:hypothetical protein
MLIDFSYEEVVGKELKTYAKIIEARSFKCEEDDKGQFSLNIINKGDAHLFFKNVFQTSVYSDTGRLIRCWRRK